MWYEIRVTKNGEYYLTISDRLVGNVDRVTEIRNRLKSAMPEEEGFEFSIDLITTTRVKVKN
jgi:hypothetical protein